MNRHWLAAPVSLALVALMPLPAAAQTEDYRVSCSLTNQQQEFVGTCEIPCRVNNLMINFDGPNMSRPCAAPPRKVDVRIKASGRPNHWLGTMTPKEPEDPNRFELIAGDRVAGVAKLPYGWFRVESASLGSQAMTLVINANRQLPPGEDDRKIITRAKALLASPAVWNKQDNRQCAPNPQRWSLFCAMMQATEEVSGGIHYRQPALQAMREAVNDVGGTRVDKHRIMDYNNHPDTTLADIHALLDLAQSKLDKRGK
jgi:hypothetical protein